MKDVVMSSKNIFSYMEIAKLWSKNSYAKRAKVGCIIVKDNMIISDGYNGMPSGLNNNCEIELNGEYHTRHEVIHAESNAICKLAKSTQSSSGACLFTTMAPCYEGAKLIIQSEINCVYYLEEYKSPEGLDLLSKVKIKTIQLTKATC